MVHLVLLRRFLALLVLGATMLSSAESALALKPDARLHGVIADTAAAHGVSATVMAGEHADTGSPEHRQPQQNGHRHGSFADHCTHAHAVGLASSVRWIPTATEHRGAIHTVIAAYADADPHRALRPPRA
ncbi:MAG: hypothetical protein H3C62_05390 [Gemmatimonadaceae bacterium]|nr:hypothetical protein [Gemmatimonadaceae bacterium]